MALTCVAAAQVSCGLLLGLDDFEDAPRASAGGTGAGGESSGSSGAPGCAHGARDCVGDTPRQCADGEWVHQRPCSGEAPVCAQGGCVPCTEGERGCAGNRPQRCEGGAWIEQAACVTPLPGCRDGQCVPTSCQFGEAPGTGIDCGADGRTDCCAMDVVPGGTFYRGNNDRYPATVSQFRLDRYEVTVGRFRAFVDALKGTQADPPPPGAGERPGVADSGWEFGWTSALAANTTELKTQLECDYYPTWTATPGPNENRPIHCVTWYEAFAFCVWDGGHLPTEAEWNYAAAGGAEQRTYPWGSSREPGFAAHGCRGNGSSTGCNISAFLPVGSFSPSGDARWGHADMLGNTSEWTLDCSGDYPVPCENCSNHGCSGSIEHVVRGGNAIAPLYDTTFRNREYRTSRTQGVRCARKP
ncbi:formylglycine-generating enzyme family protein [Sorangium sp. So ce590]|uniref:formylglycine-generating enzyme family protein n=1 Tax=unclassified Sorangium TaxID=2621164 RepID=UPI003F5EBD58